MRTERVGIGRAKVRRRSKLMTDLCVRDMKSAFEKQSDRSNATAVHLTRFQLDNAAD